MDKEERYGVPTPTKPEEIKKAVEAFAKQKYKFKNTKEDEKHID